MLQSLTLVLNACQLPNYKVKITWLDKVVVRTGFTVLGRPRNFSEDLLVLWGEL